MFRGFGTFCPPPPPGGLDPPVIVFPVEELMGKVDDCACVAVWVIVAMKTCEKRLLGCKFIGVRMALAIRWSSVSLSVIPQVGVRGESGRSSSLSDCLSGVSLESLDASISPQSEWGTRSSSTMRSPSSMGAGMVRQYFPLLHL